ncbi:hypothetical protein C8R26_104177 [Nitrosomonas oligotropha]|uniref:Restriction endonuclease n=1 Tax=Nitrosomonas oligotropha TaxID=42354 RepID=A0A2T5I306_9PROT|nr:hypothetical protein [Nitrosomonas oligotropha]PTQ78193.1 hypothetical protein C8R26_104177 [Nitrosomonas oligotropha]
MVGKIGESQTLQFFSTIIQTELSARFGRRGKYSIGNFSGSQDRRFADVFVGTESSCVLIEFKEFESEVADEQNKPLRKKFCEELTPEIASLSRSGHFIAFRKPKSQMEIIVAPYVDTVCPRFSVGIPPLVNAKRQDHDRFIKSFLGNTEGQNYQSFIQYVGHLNSIAGGTPDGSTAPFKSVLYSRNRQGRVIGTVFESIGELRKLLKLRPKRMHSSKL